MLRRVERLKGAYVFLVLSLRSQINEIGWFSRGMKPLPRGCYQRHLCPSDEYALLEFFSSHSKETVFQRYHHMIAGMSHQRALSLLSVDQRRDIALAIFEATTGGESIHAIARYYTEPSRQVAETAFVVRECKRRLGLATHLLHELGRLAHGHSLIWLRAQVLPGNYAMRALLSQFTNRIQSRPDVDGVDYLVPVSSLLSHENPHITYPKSRALDCR